MKYFSFTGMNSIHSRVRASGIIVQRCRIREVVGRIRENEGFVQSANIRRRSYDVPGSLCMWHIDGNHKLVRYVILSVGK